MVKKIIAVLGLILTAVAYALNIKPKSKESDAMVKKTGSDFHSLPVADKERILRNVRGYSKP